MGSLGHVAEWVEGQRQGSGELPLWQPPTLDIGDVSLAISKVSLMWFHLNYLRVSLMRQQKVCHCKYSEHSTDTHPTHTHTETHTHTCNIPQLINCDVLANATSFILLKFQTATDALAFGFQQTRLGGKVAYAVWHVGKGAREGQGVASIPSRLLGKIRKSHLDSQVRRVTIFRVTRAWHFWGISTKRGKFSVHI